MTLLTSETVSMLLTDLSEQDVDGYGREVILLGAEEGRLLYSDAVLEVKKFLTLEHSIIRAVLLHLEDDPCDYLYFQPQDHLLFEAKLGEVAIRIRGRERSYPYSRLGTAALDIRLDTLRELLTPDC